MASNSNLYIMEAANLIAGLAGENNQPGESTHISILGLKLPALEENYADHYPGGAQIGIEIPMYVNKLESTFNLAGWQPNIMKMMGASAIQNQWFTAYGLIRERRTGVALPAMAKMQGRLGRVNPTEYRKGDVMQHEYAIRSIVHYELYMKSDPNDKNRMITDADTIYWWDFFSSEYWVGDVDVNADMIDILAIPTVAEGAQGPEYRPGG